MSANSEDVREHDRMVNALFNDKSVLQHALNLQTVFIRGKEYQFDPMSDERADLVFQDRWNPYKGDTEAVLFVVELKSDEMDHEGLGQLKKAVDALEKTGKAIKHWGQVRGVAIARRYTTSGLQLLKDAGYSALLWSEPDGVRLTSAQKHAASKIM